MLEQLLSELRPAGVDLVAVSKTHSKTAILDLYRKGQKAFGENRVQELLPKYELLPKDIEWHLIGHLQTNKVKYVVPFIHLIHSVDSFKLLKEIDKQARQIGRVVDCLLQFKIAIEETKYGFERSDAKAMLESPEFADLKNVDVVGVMGMASFVENYAQVRSEFRDLKQIFDRLKEDYFADQFSFREISMGMSEDYQIAVQEGSTMVRIGSLLFGERSY